MFPWPGDDFDPIVAALRAGKHVLVNANAIGSIDSFQRIQNEASADRHLAIVNPDRFLPSRQFIRQQIDDGRIGRLGLIRTHWWVANGTVLGLTLLDQILWYFGKLPEVAFAHRVLNLQDQVHLGFAGGGMALATFARIVSWDPYCSLSLIGAAGAVYADEQSNMQIQHQISNHRALPMRDDGPQWAAWIQRFVDAIVEKRDHSLNNDCWRQVLAVNDAVEQSIALGDAVTLTGGPFHG